MVPVGSNNCCRTAGSIAGDYHGQPDGRRHEPEAGVNSDAENEAHDHAQQGHGTKQVPDLAGAAPSTGKPACFHAAVPPSTLTTLPGPCSMS